MYIVILDPYSDKPSVIADAKGFVNVYLSYNSAKTAGEEALYQKTAKRYIITKECNETV